MEIYAHSLEGKPPSEWQTLEDHSNGTAELAAKFAGAFGCENYGRLIGLLHDIGKARESFQAYLLKSNGYDSVEDSWEHTHSGVGALWLRENAKGQGELAMLTYCLLGHHVGLPDFNKGEGSWISRMKNEAAILQEGAVQDWIANNAPQWKGITIKRPDFLSSADSTYSFWIRMMFSCLVDADCLDTEAFMQPFKAKVRETKGDSIESLERVFTAELDKKQAEARQRNPSPVNAVRAEIRKACEEAAEQPQGLFSLSVPTGGGKTLSSTAFALKHAVKHGMKRIIYVIPYTSIIEQTANDLRKFLGDRNVLEHHSNVEPSRMTLRAECASENWDAPIVVTTDVQFFESLYAAQPRRCRKIHNIANSVVILDEVQLLPTRLLLPCAEAIKQLSQRYHTTFVLSTATQMALPGIASGEVREITPASMDLYRRLKRTEIEFPKDLNERKSWEAVADEMTRQKQVLCIVNTRRDCYNLYKEISEAEGAFHLSTLMCGAHRSKVIAEIKQRLKEDLPVRVVSTNLIEAGVDIDFPVVYRAFAGLASIVQAAGRCNREGLLCGLGKVVVFRPPSGSAEHISNLVKERDATIELWESGKMSVDNPETYPMYYREVHRRMNTLGESFLGTLRVPVPVEYLATGRQLPSAAHVGKYQFREAATDFRFIPDVQEPIIVRYGEGEELIKRLMADGINREIMRRLQRYIVNVPRKDIDVLRRSAKIEEVRIPEQTDECSGIYVQTQPLAGAVPDFYSKEYGFDYFGKGLEGEGVFA